MALIQTQHLNLAYDRRDIVRDLSLALPEGRITIVVGANGCGKSTLLRGMSRLLAPRSGNVVLDGRDIHTLRGKELARRLGLLPQTPIAPDGVSVRELVSRGRFPHQGLFQQWTAADEEAVNDALAATRTDELAHRPLEELSGGQRQRVWIAMALAQQTEALLLDEPTTYLDVTHQLEVLDVVRDLNLHRGTTVGIVLHDLNLAARYADHLVAVRDGEIYAEGAPSAVITERMVHEVFALDSRVVPDPVTGTPMVLPLGRDRSRARAGGDRDDPASSHRGPASSHRSPASNHRDPASSHRGPASSHRGPASSHRGPYPGRPAQPDPDPDPEEDAMTPSTTAHASATATAPEQVPALEHSPQLAYELTVGAIQPLGTSLKRLTFTCPDLVHFGTGGHPLDLRIKMIIPGPRPTADHFASVRPGALLDPEQHAQWYRTWLQIDPADRGWMRTYSVRELRGAGHPGNLTEHPEIDVDFVLHLEPEEIPGSGVAARWARDVQVGDTISMLGPNQHLVGPDYGGIEFRPGSARTVLLAGDETALPAICSTLEALPASISGHAVIEVPDATDQQQVLTKSGVQVTWLVRGQAPHGQLMTAEVQRLMGRGAHAHQPLDLGGHQLPARGLDPGVRAALLPSD